MAYTKIFAYVFTLVLCVAVLEGSTIQKRRATYYDTLNELSDKPNAPLTRTDDLLLRFIDALVEHEELHGATDEDLHDLKRKRAGIRKCFFHAVNCW